MGYLKIYTPVTVGNLGFGLWVPVQAVQPVGALCHQTGSQALPAHLEERVAKYIFSYWSSKIRS